MAGTLNDTPGSNRLHIGVFGKTNSGKSSFINAFTHQEVSIVADVAGTTTDPVYKPMEISPLGPCVIIDTAGFDDETELGERRVEKTKLAAEKADIAVIVVSGADACREDASETKDAKEKLQLSSEKNQSAAVSTSSVVSTFKASVAASPASTFATGSANAVTPLPVTANVAAIIKAVTCFALIFFPLFHVCAFHMLCVVFENVQAIYMPSSPSYELRTIIQYYVS